MLCCPFDLPSCWLTSPLLFSFPNIVLQELFVLEIIFFNTETAFFVCLQFLCRDLCLSMFKTNLPFYVYECVSCTYGYTWRGGQQVWFLRNHSLFSLETGSLSRLGWRAVKPWRSVPSSFPVLGYKHRPSYLFFVVLFFSCVFKLLWVLGLKLKTSTSPTVQLSTSFCSPF